MAMDTLEVLVTKDCGLTFTSVYKKWGADLSTANPAGIEFYPANTSQWRKEEVDLTEFIDSSPILVLFKLSNQNENNVFIDNVNINTVILPEVLKTRGYMIYPNHFKTNFTIWHYRPPTTLSYINIYNAAGQLVWARQYSGNAANVMTIDLGNKSNGMYIMQMGYTDKEVVIQKLIKY
jgi:hypothetical protein